MELWQAGGGRKLRLESYRASGGIHSAVARLAEDAYERLDDRGRGIARTLMLRLAADDGGTPVRRRAPLTELELIDGAPPVLAELIDSRLLTQAGAAPSAGTSSSSRGAPSSAARRVSSDFIATGCRRRC